MENSKELLLVAQAVSKEKGLNTEDVLHALEEGMETALRRNFPEGAELHVTIDPETGEWKAYRLFKLVDQIENIEGEMLFTEIDDEIVVDGYVWEQFSFTPNRQQFNITKQVALQRIKNESRDNQIHDLMDKSISLLSGTVKVIKKDQMIVDCNGLDISIYRRNLLPRDNYKNGDKIYFVLEKEKNHYVGTRISDQYLMEVFKRELVEIEEGDIEITAVARNPGFRSKVVVRSMKKNIDAVRTCIGAKGVHIKNIHNFLNGEVVDLIPFEDQPAQLLVQAMAPVNITNIVIDEEMNSMDIAVPDEEIAQAIGKGGKNIEMISKLVGWDINVFSETQWHINNNKETLQQAATLAKGLNCDYSIAQMLVEAGYTSLEEIAYLPKDEFYVEELDEETHEALRENAREVCLQNDELEQAKNFGELVGLGLNYDEAEILQNNSILNTYDVSELATDELLDIIPTIDTDRAKAIIMSARHKKELTDADNS
jgi:N utilization substance protein A